MVFKKDGNKREERAARDDWEAIKLMLDAHPPLKKKVLQKIRELRNRKNDKRPRVTSDTENPPEKKQ